MLFKQHATATPPVLNHGAGAFAAPENKSSPRHIPKQTPWATLLSLSATPLAALLLLAPTPPAWAKSCDSRALSFPKEDKETCTCLDLSSNNLISLPAGIFSGLNNLEELYLYSNSLSRLPSLPSSLQYLYVYESLTNDIDDYGLPSCGEEPEETCEENPNQETCNRPPPVATGSIPDQAFTVGASCVAAERTTVDLPLAGLFRVRMGIHSPTVPAAVPPPPRPRWPAAPSPSRLWRWGPPPSPSPPAMARTMRTPVSPSPPHGAEPTQDGLQQDQPLH